MHFTKETKMKKETTFIPNIGVAEISDYTPTFEKEKEFLKFEKEAEEDIEKQKQTETVTFRWSELEIKRAKKIAAKLGIPYQTYIKMALKQAMDEEERKYN